MIDMMLDGRKHVMPSEMRPQKNNRRTVTSYTDENGGLHKSMAEAVKMDLQYKIEEFCENGLINSRLLAGHLAEDPVFRSKIMKLLGELS